MNNSAMMRRMLKPLQNKKGVAMIFTFYLITVLIVFVSIVAVRTLNEGLMAKKERESTKAFYYAEAGANAALQQIEHFINTDLYANVNSAFNPQTKATEIQGYAWANKPLDFLFNCALSGGVNDFTYNVDKTQLSNTLGTTVLGDGAYTYTVTITPKSTPVSVSSSSWNFFYNYKIVVWGIRGAVNKIMSATGDFQVTVQKDNIAKFAVSVQQQKLKDNTTLVWFNNNTYFRGPVQSNNQLNFSGTPEFDGAVTQTNNLANFYNGGNIKQLASDHNSTLDVPVFNQSFSRNYPAVSLDSSTAQTDLSSQAQGAVALSGNGVFIPNDGTRVTGGIFTRGDTTIQMSVDSNGYANYTVGANGTTKTIIVDQDHLTTTVKQAGLADVVYVGLPDGASNQGTIIYTDGKITSLKGTVQQDTQVTVSSDADIVITDNIVYSDFTSQVGNPADDDYIPPSAEGAKNLLGILSWNGDVRVAVPSSAHSDLTIDGVVVAQKGVFQVDSYNSGSPRGTVTLLGGSITQNYGAFGTFDGSTQSMLTGYARNFVYDSRTGAGQSPPYFPPLKASVAFSTDITDKVIWREGF
ncbi:MAG: DUF4900 domain-containing protein [Candidatus Omnitrophica bacterium]|nr:DUF4900 domain-containing protein [Candidatus Omnitrophota bacterium]